MHKVPAMIVKTGGTSINVLHAEYNMPTRTSSLFLGNLQKRRSYNATKVAMPEASKYDPNTNWFILQYKILLFGF